eukprot:CAMPEP_0114496852 /NCGR_PEP_ID=MMETSP0109-20121206/5995_1 /TAXON_ID=29199 /ORGANISM="Chlorarachnion reptans, Strain CCCM449" /LENGTH=32 /DNA_ID= /DNA_START= /DNA_END= /DNA_ORIENTATION=
MTILTVLANNPKVLAPNDWRSIPCYPWLFFDD